MRTKRINHYETLCWYLLDMTFSHFQNSALYDHLQNVGFQPHEFESESHRPQQVREYDDAEFQSNVSLSKVSRD